MINKYFLFSVSRSKSKLGCYNYMSKCFATQLAQDLCFKSKTRIAKDRINNLEWNSGIPFKNIPGPSRWQLICYFLPGGKFFKKSQHYIGKVLHDEYGEIVKVPGIFKQRELILTFNPNHFEKIYRHDGIWPSRTAFETLLHYRHDLRPEIFQETGTLLTSNGEEWSKLRRIVNPILMHPTAVKIYVPRIDNTTTTFIERIRVIRDSNTLELPDSFETEIITWVLEQICLVGLDSELRFIGNKDDNNDAQKLINSVSTIVGVVGDLEFKPSLWKYYGTLKYKKVIEAYDAITNISLKYIDEAIERYKLIEKDNKRNENEKSILERLIKINKKIAVVVAIEMLFAGVDTTTSVVTGCLLSLAKNPEKQEKLRQEIRKVLPKRDTPITEQKLKTLPYLRAVIKESIRKYPVIHEQSRTTNVDFVLGNYQIPKSTDLLMNNTFYYHNNNYFSEPDKFIPERWLRNQEETGTSKCQVNATKASNPFVYLPFGFGNRMCVAKRLVDMKLEILLARMVRNFNIEYNYDENDVFELKLIYTPAKPLKFKLTDVEN